MEKQIIIIRSEKARDVNFPSFFSHNFPIFFHSKVGFTEAIVFIRFPFWNFPTKAGYFCTHTVTHCGKSRRREEFSLSKDLANLDEIIRRKIFFILAQKLYFSQRRRRWCAHVHEKNPTIPLFPQQTDERHTEKVSQAKHTEKRGENEFLSGGDGNKFSN